MIRHIIRLIWNRKRSNVLLFSEITLAFLILFSVFTIATRSFRMFSTPLGFDTENIWVAHLNLEQITDSLALAASKERLKAELKAMPQIKGVSFAGEVSPFSGSNWSTSNTDNGFHLRTNVLYADQDYLNTAGLQLMQGRWFNESDQNARYMPVVISQQLYNESFQGKNLKDSVYTIDEEVRVVGVIDHYKYQGDFTREDNATFFFKPETSDETPAVHLRIAPGTPAAFEEEVNKTIASVTKTNDFIIEHLETSRKSRNMEVWVPLVALLSICGFLVINVAMGLFGVLWYTTSKRRPEIGLRRTLGASRGEITVQFVGEVLAVSIAGLLLGLFFAVQFPLMNVFEVEAINYYIAMGLSALLILVLVLICALYPSQQASKIHPALALHEE